MVFHLSDIYLGFFKWDWGLSSPSDVSTQSVPLILPEEEQKYFLTPQIHNLDLKSLGRLYDNMPSEFPRKGELIMTKQFKIIDGRTPGQGPSTVYQIFNDYGFLDGGIRAVGMHVFCAIWMGYMWRVTKRTLFAFWSLKRKPLTFRQRITLSMRKGHRIGKKTLYRHWFFPVVVGTISGICYHNFPDGWIGSSLAVLAAYQFLFRSFKSKRTYKIFFSSAILYGFASSIKYLNRREEERIRYLKKQDTTAFYHPIPYRVVHIPK